jgi:3'(2'), 5'-bisphosphate nucleotidase
VSADAALLDEVQAIAQRAAAHIMAVYARTFCVDHKADSSPVTEADLAANAVIVEGLAALTPAWPVLSEEGEPVPFELRQQWRRYWLVDPLDGTREFIKGNGEFTINIALIDAGQPVVGVIHVPVTGDCYFASQGGGAFKQMKGQAAEPIRVRHWDGGHITIAGSRSYHSENFKALLNNFNARHVLTLGSSLKSCYIAEGRADLYARLGPTGEWDTAAAQCILEEAGGRMTDLELNPLRYNRKESLINPPFLAFGDGRHDWRRYLPES